MTVLDLALRPRAAPGSRWTACGSCACRWLFRFNKGVVMPGFPVARGAIRRHDVVSIHLPQVEAALVTALARLTGRRPVLTYHCDLQMPPVWYGRSSMADLR